MEILKILSDYCVGYFEDLSFDSDYLENESVIMQHKRENTRVHLVVDGSEQKIQTPKDKIQRDLTYSGKKSIKKDDEKRERYGGIKILKEFLTLQKKCEKDGGYDLTRIIEDKEEDNKIKKVRIIIENVFATMKKIFGQDTFAEESPDLSSKMIPKYFQASSDEVDFSLQDSLDSSGNDQGYITFLIVGCVILFIVAVIAGIYKCQRRQRLERMIIETYNSRNQHCCHPTSSSAVAQPQIKYHLSIDDIQYYNSTYSNSLNKV
ncbi:hypothetical protein PPL_09807 [Heterostelium album PN500]|uniref:Uncharacterized protein n=1 Tax=Heterostelium pallidum (strain ATCC 26659 / Pp 5 / PN500) TaxID=670386 RepID=D3BP44_HETP5|nr:hypothetical protein PPL_09807 [Heterostelium album PN500]EFA77054.1 hypothetical protein PPL_09807 [Heterostelium album PN500]|eukprot:XP_020429183.1 hypothetical protein PPL_09807 [Heterostelium album PN500]